MSDAEYDPVARRERYLRTRELKGRKKGSAETNKSGTSSRKLTDAERSQKDALKKENANRKKLSAEVSSKNQKELAQLKQNIQTQRNELTNKLREALKTFNVEQKQTTENLTKKRDARLADIAAERQSKLARIPDIPSNATGKAYERHMQRRLKAIQRIEGETSAKEAVAKNEFRAQMAKANKDFSDKKKFVQTLTKNQQEQLRLQLKGSVEKSRSKYDTLKKELRPRES